MPYFLQFWDPNMGLLECCTTELPLNLKAVPLEGSYKDYMFAIQAEQELYGLEKQTNKTFH